MKKMVLVAFAGILIAGLASCGRDETAAEGGARELTIWESLWPNTSVSVSSLDETPLYQEVQARTGIDVTWIHPAQGQEDEQFNLMIASNDLPDLIYRHWLNDYPGGPEKAISDGVIIELNDVFADYAPNLTGLFEENSLWEKSAKTDSGTFYAFPFVRGHEALMVFYGPQLRADWLDELGMDVPETWSDWEETLTAMKEAGLSEYPLTFTRFDRGRGINGPGNAFIQPFGTTWDFHQIDGEVMFGPYEDEYLDFLTAFKAWFDAGLVDPEFFSNERSTFDAKILNGEVGGWTSYTGSGIGAYLDANGGEGTFDIVPAPYPVLNEGETPFFGQRDVPVRGSGMAITTQASDVQLAAEYADFAYSEEGHLLFNFGIEGESYEWTTEYPGFEGERWAAYTDMMFNDPQGRTLSQMGGLYTRSFYEGPIVQDRQYIFQYANRQSQRDAIQIWAQTDVQDHMLPPVSATPEESEELAEIMSEVQTYREEMFVRFITGQEPLSNFDAFQARLEQMGIERAIEIKQAGLERFNAR
jgi:putative aldouronate transport system substrate-binding protein